MNYAEAVYKYLGSPYATDNEFTTSAVDAIKVVRTRAEMPGFPQGMTNDAFWKKYQNERMVELAFEGHRFGMYVVGRRVTNISRTLLK